MPPKSRARSGRGEPAQPSRKSARISLKTEEKLPQVAPTARKQTLGKKARKEKPVSSVPKLRSGLAKENNDNPTALPQRKIPQARITRSSKKNRKASPIAVSGREAGIDLSDPSTSRSRSKITLQKRRSDASVPDYHRRVEVPQHIVDFWHSRGYEVSDEESMASTVQSTKASTQNSQKLPRLPKGYKVDCDDKRYSPTLKEHNIELVPVKDPKIEHFRKLIFFGDTNIINSQESLEKEIINRREDALWKMDMSKCARSNEARFQRTIMITIINRLELDKNLEFIPEARWKSERFPCLNCLPMQCKITKPQPDLAVAFQATSLLPTDGFTADYERLKEIESHIFPEGNQEFQDQHAFHFFFMEVKGKRGTIDNQKAQFQNLNTASQAVYNIYRCMKRVNDLDTFFKEIRIFSASTTVAGLSIRVHRPRRLRNVEQCNKREYPIAFQFDELGSIKGDYSRAQALSIVYNILYEYGIRVLHPILKTTIETLLKLYPRDASGSSLQALEEAATTIDETDSPPASQHSSGRKRRAPNLGDSFTSNSRRRLGSFNINDSQGSEVDVEG